jgi:hypothetical protein
MKPPTEQELKEFCRLAGVHWHEWDGVETPVFHKIACTCGFEGITSILAKHIQASNPTFRYAEEVLEVMMKRNDKYDFIQSILPKVEFAEQIDVLIYFYRFYIANDYILWWKAFEWMKKGE